VIPLRDNIPSRQVPLVNYLLILFTCGVFAGQVADKDESLILRYALIPSRLQHPERPVLIESRREVRTAFGVQEAEARVEIPPLSMPSWLTATTSIFLHGSLLHLLGNLWFLWIFGDNVEDRLGHGLYFLFYLLGGTLAGFCHYAVDPSSSLPTIGASGAVAAVMGAYLCFFPHANVISLVPLVFFLHLMVIPAPVFLGLWFLLQLLQGGFAIGMMEAAGVAWWAHIGGFLAGLCFALLFRLAAGSGPREMALRPGTQRRFTRMSSPWD
jgi:hypothetical protein